MNYRSIADMNRTILESLHRLPRDLDLVVGVPRSGLLAAQMLGAATGLPVVALDDFLEKRTPAGGAERRVLVLEDSLSSGIAMQEARDRVAAAHRGEGVLYAAVYGLKPQHPEADVIFEAVPQPRMFQWNAMHHKFLARCCVDIDGILCHDPSEAENDDGPAYLDFLLNARPLNRTRQRIGMLVTSRLEKYRPQTEAWLAAQGIAFDRLAMLDLPSREERMRRGAHGSFKASVYRESDALLFIESEPRQAAEIMRLSGRPVLCLPEQRLYQPDLGHIAAQIPRLRSCSAARHLVRQAAWSVLGPDRFSALSQRLRGA
ncbi:phosphoribosyltransferase [Cereibacter sphaeroides]|uniref:Phosphoribosyltransferase n=1 Tax=Cereibacter sphaeroides TaxID=1063 RepID=A0AAX1UL97_CERSP|nr:phosphoribosyltransferase [Cereibacter sphaeroides]RHZ95189.1 phosphoribosyltransferase [Cereibacter sphaeroides]